MQCAHFAFRAVCRTSLAKRFIFHSPKVIFTENGIECFIADDKNPVVFFCQNKPLNILFTVGNIVILLVSAENYDISDICGFYFIYPLFRYNDCFQQNEKNRANTRNRRYRYENFFSFLFPFFDCNAMFLFFAFALQTVGFRFTLCFQSFGFLITFTSGYFFIFYPKSMKTKTPRSRYTCEVSVFVIWQSTFSRQSLLFLKSAVRLLPGADIVDVYLCVISFCTISGLFAAFLCALDSLFRFKYAAINTVAKDKMDDTIFIQSRSAKIVDRIPM